MKISTNGISVNADGYPILGMPQQPSMGMDTSGGPQAPNDPIPSWAKAGIKTVGAGLGAFAGAEAGPVGSIPLAGLGAAGGQALINLLERLKGGPVPATLHDNLATEANAGITGATNQGVGEGIGLAANPIKPVTALRDMALKNSGQSFDIGKLLEEFMTGAPQKYAAQGVLPKESAPLLDVLKQRIYAMTLQKMNEINPSSMKPLQQILNDAGPENPISQLPLKLPAFEANQIKQQIPNMPSIGDGNATLADAYAGGGAMKPTQAIPADFYTMLNKAIHGGVPIAGMADKTASIMHNIGDFAPNIISKLPGGKAINTALSLGPKTLGGIGNIAPFLLNLLTQGSTGSTNNGYGQ